MLVESFLEGCLRNIWKLIEEPRPYSGSLVRILGASSVFFPVHSDGKLESLVAVGKLEELHPKAGLGSLFGHVDLKRDRGLLDLDVQVSRPFLSRNKDLKKKSVWG